MLTAEWQPRIIVPSHLLSPFMNCAFLSYCCSVLLFKYSRKFDNLALYWYPLLISGFLCTFSKVNFVNIFFSFPLQKFIEEKNFLAQLDTSFQKCEEMCKNLGKVSSLLYNDMAIVSRRHLFYLNGWEMNFSHVCFLGGNSCVLLLILIVFLILFSSGNYFLTDFFLFVLVL